MTDIEKYYKDEGNRVAFAGQEGPRQEAWRKLEGLGYDLSPDGFNNNGYLEVHSLEHLAIAFDAGISARFHAPPESEAGGP